jgi:MFS family permease
VSLLVQERDFRLIVIAMGLSSLGDVLAAVALTIRVHDLTGSGLAVAALLLADLVAHVVFAPWAGMLVDRVETVRVLAAVSLGQAAVAVALAFTHAVPLLIVLLFLLGAGAGVVTCRGQKPQSWAGPAVSPGRHRRVSSFLGYPRDGIRSSILIRRPCGAPSPSGARSRPGADLSA